jgi:hypothetical protein
MDDELMSLLQYVADRTDRHERAFLSPVATWSLCQYGWAAAHPRPGRENQIAGITITEMGRAALSEWEAEKEE